LRPPKRIWKPTSTGGAEPTTNSQRIGRVGHVWRAEGRTLNKMTWRLWRDPVPALDGKIRMAHIKPNIKKKKIGTLSGFALNPNAVVRSRVRWFSFFFSLTILRRTTCCCYFCFSFCPFVFASRFRNIVQLAHGSRSPCLTAE